MKIEIAIILITFSLVGGCTTTKLVEVPVPVPCNKPNNLPVPHDHMADLDKNSTAKQFVPACLATIEEYKNSYSACMMAHVN